jgi:hypothetical protein
MMDHDPNPPADASAPLATPARRRPRSKHDETFWAAVRATYASGVAAHRAAKLFGIGASTLMREAKAGGWLRKDLARESDAALAAAIATGALQARSPTDRPKAFDDSVVPTVVVAAQAALIRASEATLHGDTERADAVARLGDRLFKTAKDLGWSPATAIAAELEQIGGAAEGEALLRRIEEALDAGRDARRLEVEALESHGLDPRRAWFWDAASGDWIWDAARALAEDAAFRQAARLEEIRQAEENDGALPPPGELGEPWLSED